MQDSLQHLLAKQWSDQKMVDHCIKNSVYLDMGEYYLDLLSKPTITKTIYYADQDYATGKMAKDPGTSWEVFKNHNMRMNSPQKWIENLEKNHQVIVITIQYHVDKTGGRLKGWTTKRSYEVAPEDKEATEKETKIIIEGLKQEVIKYDKRLKTYFKRYSDKIRTSSYWAER